jgi:hypothetical protein
MRALSLLADQRPSVVTERLYQHLGADPRELPTTAMEFAVRLDQRVVVELLYDRDVRTGQSPYERLPAGGGSVLGGA